MIHAVLVRFSEEIVLDVVHIEEGREEDGVGVNADANMCIEGRLGHDLHRRCRNCVRVGGKPCQDDDGHRNRFQSSRLHRVLEEGGTLLLRTPD